MGTINMVLERAELECVASEMVRGLAQRTEQDLIDSTASLALLGHANELLSASLRLAMEQRHHQFNFHNMPGKRHGNAMLLAADGQQTELDRMGEKILRWVQVHADKDPAAVSTAEVDELCRITRVYLEAEQVTINSYHQLLRQRVNMAYRDPARTESQ